MTESVANKEQSRRDFLGTFSQLFLGLWGIGFLGVVYAYLRPRRKEMVSEGVFRVAALGGWQVGEARIEQHPAGPILVVRTADREVVALSAVCTHLRCILKYQADSKTVLCPCHGGAFDLNGNVLYGPPPRPLPRFAAEIRNDEIYVRVS